MKLLKILKINLLSLVAIPLLLLATAFKLLAKSLEKIPLFIGLLIASLIILSASSFSASAASIVNAIAIIIVACLMFGIIIAILFWIFSLISGAVILIYSLIVGCFDALYNFCYMGYLSLHTTCESDYQLLSLNGKKTANAFLCPFYSILRALSWLITTVVSLSLPAAVICSIGLIILTLYDLNKNTQTAFGLSLLQYAGKCPTASVIGGVFIYLAVMAIAITAIMSFALEWYEWAQDLKMSEEEISEDIAHIRQQEIQVASGRPDEIEDNMEYLRLLESHMDHIDSLGTQVQEILSQKDNAMLRSNWGIYMRNLNYLVRECSSKNGITMEQLKKLIPQIQQLDKQCEDVRRMVDKLSGDLKNPAGSTVFFMGCDTPEKLDKRYRSLCKTYHPDVNNGDTTTFQKMKEEYESLKAVYQAETK